MTAETKPAVSLMAGPQTEFFESKARHPAMFSGRGGGKTVADVTKGFAYVCEHPGAEGVLTAPSFPMVKTTLLPTFRSLFGDYEGTFWIYKRADMEIVFPTLGSRIYLRPGNEPDRLRGMNLAFFGMGEIAIDHQHETFLILFRLNTLLLYTLHLESQLNKIRGMSFCFD